MIYGQLIQEHIKREENDLDLYVESLESLVEALMNQESYDMIEPLEEGANSDYIKAYRSNKKDFKDYMKEAKKAIKADDEKAAKAALGNAKNSLKKMQKDLNDVKDDGSFGTKFNSSLIAIFIETIHDAVSSIAFLGGAGAIGTVASQMKIYNKVAEKNGATVAKIGNSLYVGGNKAGVDAVSKAVKTVKHIDLAGAVSVMIWFIKVSIANMKDVDNFKREAKKGNMDNKKDNKVYMKLSRYCKELENCISKLEAKL